MTNRAKAVFLLLVLLVVFLLIARLPDHVAATRIAGVSLLWWYGGVVAPLLAWLIALVWLPDRPPARADSPSARPAARRPRKSNAASISSE